MLIAIEGIDGAGKNTLTGALRSELTQRRPGLQVTSIAFPRYAESKPAELAGAALHGRMGDLDDSPYAMATLFALDRHGAARELREAASRGVALCDRYVASNAAYSLARTGEDAIVQWVYDLEFGRLGLPRPDITVLVDTPPETAARRAEHREAHDPARARDRYERSGELQRATWQAYVRLAEESWASPWLVTSDPIDIFSALAERGALAGRG